jgi:hypothetical protein
MNIWIDDCLCFFNIDVLYAENLKNFSFKLFTKTELAFFGTACLKKILKIGCKSVANLLFLAFIPISASCSFGLKKAFPVLNNVFQEI